jgi:hypothetical protein
MKQALILPGGPASVDGDKAKRWGITRLYWGADDPNATPALLKSVRAAGIGVGVMRVMRGETAEDLAEQMSQDLSDKGFNWSTGPDSCAAIFDNENHGSAYARDSIKSFRVLRPLRTLLWTLESGQGGWFEPDLVDLINADPNLVVVPQLYFGTPRMYPVSERFAVENLALRGIRRDRLACFYDGEKPIPYGWFGIIYGFNQLPSSPPIPL